MQTPEQTVMNIWRAHGGKMDRRVAKIAKKALYNLHRMKIGVDELMDWASLQPNTRVEY